MNTLANNMQKAWMDEQVNEFAFSPFLRGTSGSRLPSNWKVYIGLVSQLQLPIAYNVKQIILHENYDPVTKDNDIALLKLSKSASKFVHTHTQNYEYISTQVHMTYNT